MHSANNVMCPSLRELISSSGSWWVLKGLRVHSKFIVGLPAPMGRSTNGWPWGLAAPDLRRSCLTTSVPPGWPRPSLPLASTFNSLIFDQIIKQTPAFRCTAGWSGGEEAGLALSTQIWCGRAVRQYPSRHRRTHLSGSPAGRRLRSPSLFYHPVSCLLFNASHLDLELKPPCSQLPSLEVIIKKTKHIYICIYAHTYTLLRCSHFIQLIWLRVRLSLWLLGHLYTWDRTRAIFSFYQNNSKWSFLHSPPPLSAAMTQKPARLKCWDFHQLLCSSIKGTYAKETSLWLLRAWGTSTCQTWGRNVEREKKKDCH